jgi:pimeloyl-ACP methyl ester carboxylesterase
MTPQDDAGAPVTRYLETADGRIAYDVQGSGPLVVMVPGMGELRSSYRFLAPAIAAAGYRVVTTDLRGHGESDAGFPSYGDEATASDISALIDEVGQRRAPAVIVGNSLAAGAAVIVAARHPERVSGLVLVGPFVRNPPGNAVMTAIFRAMTMPLWAAAAWRAYMPMLYAGRKPDDFDAYRAAVHASMRRPAYRKAFSLTTRQTDHAPAAARLAEVQAPVLLVMGERDPDFPEPAVEAHWVADALGGRVVIVPDAGHYPQAQQPESTSRAVLAFLAESVAGSGTSGAGAPSA